MLCLGHLFGQVAYFDLGISAMTSKIVMSAEEINRSLIRIAHEVLERNHGAENLVFVGIMTRGLPLAKRLCRLIEEFEGTSPSVDPLDIGLYRDDLSSRNLWPTLRRTSLPRDVSGKGVVLVDDVLYTGRTVRAALDAIVDMGRPQYVQLAVLVDRGHRQLPVRADYVGKNIPTSLDEDVEVKLAEIDGEDLVSIVRTE